MLAALSSLVYFLGTTLRLEGYAAYFLPLPMALMAQRYSERAAPRTLLSTFVLLGVVVGPLKAVNYLCVHGVYGTIAAVCWARGEGWGRSVVAGAAARGFGIVASLALSSFLVNENLFVLLLANVEALLYKVSIVAGINGALPPAAIGLAIAVLMMIHCVTYVLLIHILYAGILSRMQLKYGRPPAFLRGAIP